jgi:hypothetical protein
VLRQFFGMYRATAEDDDVAAAVVSVGQALVTVGDKAAHDQVQAAATDPSTVPYASERLGAILSAMPQTPPPGDGKGESPKKTK